MALNVSCATRLVVPPLGTRLESSCVLISAHLEYRFHYVLVVFSFTFIRKMSETDVEGAELVAVVRQTAPLARCKT